MKCKQFNSMYWSRADGFDSCIILIGSKVQIFVNYQIFCLINMWYDVIWVTINLDYRLKSIVCKYTLHYNLDIPKTT